MARQKKQQFNVLEHELVPEHRVLSPEEAARVLRELGVEPWQLPWISYNDPVVKAIGAQPGDIIEIKRKSFTAGEIKVYRVVVAYSRK